MRFGVKKYKQTGRISVVKNSVITAAHNTSSQNKINHKECFKAA